MAPKHHPAPETMISFASGALPNAVSAVVACHLTMCRICAADFRRLEILGGLLLDRIEIDANDNADTEFVTVDGLIEREEEVPKLDRDGAPDGQLLPRLLALNLPESESRISWNSISAGVWQHIIRLPYGSGRMRVLRLTPGMRLPRTGRSGGTELAILIQGELTDRRDEFARGDIIELAKDSESQPRATGNVDCVFLIAEDVRFPDFRMPYRSIIELRRKVLPVRLLVPGSWQRAVALAAGLALMIGVGLGWLIRGEMGAGTIDDLIRSDGIRLIAEAGLRSALETLPSGEERTIANGQQIRISVRMTFQDQTGDYCRRYQIIAASSERYSGIACYQDRDWIVRLQARVPPARSASQNTVPASGDANAATDVLIGSWMSGNPIVGQAEAELMRKGWQE